MHRAQTLWLASFFVAAMLLAGCGAPEGDVRGTVKYDGKLIEDGSIRFEAVDGKSKTTGGNIKAGQYAVRVPVGEMKVTISGAKGTGTKKKLYENKDEYVELKGELLPEKYSDSQKTELRLSVKPGANDKDWDLSK